MVQILKVACVLLCLVGASGHTLVVCTDLSADRQSCNGYSRSVETYFTRGDGHLIAANKNGPPCGDFNTLTDASYSATYPMAKAALGSKITIGWPSNNHQKANPAGNVPDSRNSGDDNVAIFQAQNPQPGRDILVETPKATPSYSNCFNTYNTEFTSGSAGNAKFFCTAELTMPTTPGTYTYVWAWKLAEFYYSCFDVEVGGSSERPPTTPTPAAIAPTKAPTLPPGTEGACSQFAVDYCVSRGYPGCYKDAGNQQNCGRKPDKGNTGGGQGTSNDDCPQIIRNFCNENYPGTTCAPTGGNSYRCIQSANAAASEQGEPQDMVDEVVDTIVSTSDIAKEAKAAEEMARNTTDSGSGARYSVFNSAVLLLLGYTFFFFAYKQ